MDMVYCSVNTWQSSKYFKTISKKRQFQHKTFIYQCFTYKSTNQACDKIHLTIMDTIEKLKKSGSQAILVGN